MNILFYTVNEVAPQYGGVERITANIATALTTFYNANCYSAYKYDIDSSFEKQQFVDTIKITSYNKLTRLIQFIEQNKIDVIINQGEHKLTKNLKTALSQSQRKECKLIFALHTKPAAEVNFITLDNPKKELKEGKHGRIEEAEETALTVFLVFENSEGYNGTATGTERSSYGIECICIIKSPCGKS